MSVSKLAAVSCVVERNFLDRWNITVIFNQFQLELSRIEINSLNKERRFKIVKQIVVTPSSNLNLSNKYIITLTMCF